MTASYSSNLVDGKNANSNRKCKNALITSDVNLNQDMSYEVF